MDEDFFYSDGTTPVVASFDGGDGNDTLHASFSSNSYAGNSVHSDFVDHGDGTFTVTYYDTQATGNRENQVTVTNVENIRVTINNHYSYGGAILDQANPDTIITGGGDDYVFTDSGNDFVSVGKGLDEADGGTGYDFISKDLSDATTDIVWNLATNTYSGPGSFTNFEAFVTLLTGSGNDTIVTNGPGNPPANYGADSPTDTPGNETISTGAGNDSVAVFQGIDTVDMGSGNDSLLIDYSDTFFVGGTIMTLVEDFAGTYSGSLVSSFSGGERGSVYFSGVEHFTIHTNEGGGNGSNTVDDITTGDGDDTVFTYASNDLIRVGRGTDVVDGGAGNDGLAKRFETTDDAVNINLVANSFSGGTGNFSNIEYFIDLKTTNSNDVIVTSGLSTGDDLIYTFGGNDTVTVSGGDDTVHMGAGNDRLIIDFSSDQNFTGDTNMTLVGSGSYSGTFDSIFANGPQITFSGVESFTIKTNVSRGNGSNTKDNVVTGNGDDIIYTYASNDTVSSGGGNDFIDGGAGNDTINAGAGNDIVIGGTGNDNLMGGAGTDTLNAGDGDDLLYGHAGSDTLRGQVGNDTLSGGLGHDDLFGGSGADTLEGDGGNDRLYGNADNDVVNGGAGNDNVFGGGGDDHLDGSNGADILNGHAGDDVIVGGTGNDLLTGGPGADTFLFHPGHLGGGLSATDRIKDFSHAQGDLIDLHNLDADTTAGGDQAFTWIGGAAFSGTAGELRFSFAGNTTTITGDTDGDGTADFALWLTGQIGLTESDFVL